MKVFTKTHVETDLFDDSGSPSLLSKTPRIQIYSETNLTLRSKF